MASGGCWHLYEIPNPVMEELYKMLDRTQKWKELAGRHLHWQQGDIQYLEYRERHGISPSREVLQEWASEDPTVDELFVFLSKMRFYQAMILVKEYASPHLHELLRGEGGRASLLKSVRRSSQAKQKGGDWGAVAAAGPASLPPPCHPSSSEMAAGGISASDMNLNQNFTKEMMTTKLRADEVARLLDSKFGSKMDSSAGSSTLNNVSRPAASSPGRAPSQTTRPGDGGAPPPPRTESAPPPPLLAAGASAAAAPAATGAAAAATAASSAAATAASPAAATAASPAAATAASPAAATAASPAAATAASPAPATAAPEEKIRNNSGDPDETEVKRKYSQDVCSYMDRLGNIPRIAYKELEAATDGWSQDRVLGSGGFGTVYRGTWKNTVWAIKRITQTASGRTEAEQQEQMRQTLEELRILNSCRHDNILPLCGYSISGPEPLLLYQFMDNGSLLDRIMCRRGSRPLAWLQRHNVARGTARGLQFLHTRSTTPLIHGDIKSANILLDHHLEAKIGDFGLAREFPQTHHTSLTVTRVHGTRPYLPDEYLRSRRLSEKVDTYSFGVVLFELTTGLPAYDDKRPIKMLKALVEDTVDKSSLMDRKGGSADVDIFPALLRVGELCVSRRSKDRPEMVQVLTELDSITQARNLAARAQRISIDEAPSVEMSPLELQVLMDRRQQDGRQLSPRPSPQAQRSGSPQYTGPGLSAFSAATAPPPYSEVVAAGPRPAYLSPQPPHRQPGHSPQLSRQMAHSPQPPQFQMAPSPQPPQFQMAPSPQPPQFQMVPSPQPPHFQAAYSPQYQMAYLHQYQMAYSPQWQTGQSALGPGLSPPQWQPSPPSSVGPLPTVLPHVLECSEEAAAGGEPAPGPPLGPAPLLTALGLKSSSQTPSAGSLRADSQLSTGGSYSGVSETQ